MTKHADPDARTKQLVCRAKTKEQENEFKAFKEICVRNSLQVSEQLYEFGVKGFLKAHNWPPGNSQTLLKVFCLPPVKPQAPPHCFMQGCRQPGTQELRFKPTGRTYQCCPGHSQRVLENENWEAST